MTPAHARPSAPLPAGDGGGWIRDAIGAISAGDLARATDVLGRVPERADAAAVAAAGRICLLAHDPNLARALFRRALELDGASFRATLGNASAAMMLHDFASAARAFKAARDLTTDKDERAYLTAAVADLSRMDISGH